MAQTLSKRINKYISESGMCSRREADRYIEQGNVRIDGRREAEKRSSDPSLDREPP
jgi:23S rRNA pseudouridine2604 synthase